jgi:stage V sporulation protein G
MEELQLDLIRVSSFPGSIFKFHLIYKAGNATGIVGVYSFDENWYYLYKRDTDKYMVKRRKDLEREKPYVLYEQRYKRCANKQYVQKSFYFKQVKIAENREVFAMEGFDLNNEVQKYFGDRFSETATMSRFEVMIDHFSQKFSISCEQAKEAYEKTRRLHEEGKIEKFSGYFAAICKSMSTKEYSPEQNQRYIEYNIRQRKDDQLIDFMQRYEKGERRVFAPHYGITKKEHNDMAYEAARLELQARTSQHNAPGRSFERSMASP